MLPIENRVVSGALEVGTTLSSERDLMEAFDVGRPAIREALLLLQRSGFITMSSSGRHVVPRPTTDTILELLSGFARSYLATSEGESALQNARQLFEPSIARRAPEHATPNDITVLAEALEANHRRLGDMAAFEQTDVEFHRVLAEIGDNPVVGALHEAISAWLPKQRSCRSGSRGSQRVR